MRVLLTGSTGFIGSALASALRARGDVVVPVVRRSPGAGEVGIDLEHRTLDASRLEGGTLEGIDAAAHLAGAPIATRWSPKRLEEIRSSRITAGHLLATALRDLASPAGVLVSSSAIGIYGDRGEEVLDEQSAPGTGTLADICRAWEAATGPATSCGMRVATVRTGIVIGDGGILKAQLPFFKAGLGARLGSGRQWTSWISLADEISIWLRCIDDAAISGPVNAVSPNPVRNAELTAAIAAAVGRTARLAVPRSLLRVGLGAGPADEMLLASQRVRPERLGRAGFDFVHGELAGAIAAAL